MDAVKPMNKTVAVASCVACGMTLLIALALSAVHSKAAMPASSTSPSIDGTFELTERTMANGTVLRPPSIAALYTNAHGRFSLNLFVKKDDGTVASESTVGRYTFSADRYCEWILYTLRKDLDTAGVSNEAPPVTAHCTPVSSKDGRANFSPPGEGVDVSYGREGFTAKIGAEFVDHWMRIR